MILLNKVKVVKLKDTKLIPVSPDMANLASAHNLTALSKAALRYAHENVETVLQSQEFLKSPVSQVIAHLIRDNNYHT